MDAIAYNLIGVVLISKSNPWPQPTQLKLVPCHITDCLSGMPDCLCDQEGSHVSGMYFPGSLKEFGQWFRKMCGLEDWDLIGLVRLVQKTQKNTT